MMLFAKLRFAFDTLLLFTVCTRSGDAYRGLRYLNRAYDGGCEDEDLYVIRCQCHLKLGNFTLADKVLLIYYCLYSSR